MTAATADPRLRGVLREPFAEQLAAWRNRLGRLLPTATWRDLQKNAHDAAFVVAGAMKADLLADFAGAVDKAIAQGTSLDEFRQDFDAIVARHGWEYNGPRDWRTRVIYTTNMRSTYAAGRLAQLQEGGFPYWLYRHGGSADPRPTHLAWDGLVLPADHPFWETHSPPNGWGCSCRVVGVSSPEAAARLGGQPEKRLPGDWQALDARTGEPRGIDEGWGYQPGATVVDTVQALARKLPDLPAPIAAAQGRLLQPHIQRAWRNWAEGVLSDPQVRGRRMVLGALRPADVAWLSKHAERPIRADISLEDRLIVGKKARRHEEAGDALTPEEWRDLAASIENAEAVLYDTVNDNVLLVAPSADGRRIKVAVAINYLRKGNAVENSTRSVFKVKAQALRDRRRYRVIRGRVEE